MKLSNKKALLIATIGASLSACSTMENTQIAEQVVPTPAPSRAGLKAGLYDAETAAWNIELAHSVKSPPGFFDPGALWSPATQIALAKAIEAGEDVDQKPSPISFANSDLAFTGDRIVMGNFHGFNVFENSESGEPNHILSVVCPGGQGDVSVHGNLVFYSVEQNRGRLDCGADGVEGDSSAERFRGIRIFDISDLNAPRQVAAVQTCRGSHTHTQVPHPTDDNMLYLYNSGTAGVRPDTELEGCSDGEPDENPDTALYSIDVIAVPLNAPENAAVINRPRVFADRETGVINSLWKGGEMEEGAQKAASTIACHDITAYPAYNIAAGACGGNGILLDISDPVNPKRIDEVSDPNMAYWHSATFTNDASKVLFTDEWGGGIGARCQAKDPATWGADVIADLDDNEMSLRGFFKIPGTQTDKENCVAHNGSLVPVPGRDIMVQGWYSGGLSIIDFTDSDNPYEIAFFDRGPVSEDDLYLAGFWAAYWHNGRVYAPEIVRGLEVFKLLPSEHLSAAEIAAAESVMFEEENTQTQLHLEWADSPAVARAYLDQLNRSNAVSAELAADTAKAINRWNHNGSVRDLIVELKAASVDASGRDVDRFINLARMFERMQ